MPNTDPSKTPPLTAQPAPSLSPTVTPVPIVAAVAAPQNPPVEPPPSPSTNSEPSSTTPLSPPPNLPQQTIEELEAQVRKAALELFQDWTKQHLLRINTACLMASRHATALLGEEPPQIGQAEEDLARKITVARLNDNDALMEVHIRFHTKDGDGFELKTQHTMSGVLDEGNMAEMPRNFEFLTYSQFIRPLLAKFNAFLNRYIHNDNPPPPRPQISTDDALSSLYNAPKGPEPMCAGAAVDRRQGS